MKQRLQNLVRRYHADVRRLKSSCTQSGYELRPKDEASSDWICVLSMSDYEIDEIPENCNISNEPYFLSPGDYDKYREKYGYEY